MHKSAMHPHCLHQRSRCVSHTHTYTLPYADSPRHCDMALVKGLKDRRSHSIARSSTIRWESLSCHCEARLRAYSTVWLGWDDKLKNESLKICVREDTKGSPVLNEVAMLQRLGEFAQEADHTGLDFMRLAQDIFEINGPSGQIIVWSQNHRDLVFALCEDLSPMLYCQNFSSGLWYTGYCSPWIGSCNMWIFDHKMRWRYWRWHQSERRRVGGISRAQHPCHKSWKPYLSVSGCHVGILRDPHSYGLWTVATLGTW